jgi:hypothetical protein
MGAAASGSRFVVPTRVPIALWFRLPVIKSPSQVAGHCPVFDLRLGWQLTNGDHGRDGVPALPDLAARPPLPPPGAPTRRQITAQCAARLPWLMFVRFPRSHAAQSLRPNGHGGGAGTQTAGSCVRARARASRGPQ